MVIWARWGILGLLIPVTLIVIAMIGAEAVAKQRTGNEDRKPAKQAPTAEGAEEASPAEPEEAKAAERKQADEERKRAAERDKAIKRAGATGYLIGGLASAAVLWPVGRRLNGSSGVADQQGWGPAEPQAGGGHTMFFIPLEYWGFIWAVIGLFKFLGSA